MPWHDTPFGAMTLIDIEVDPLEFWPEPWGRPKVRIDDYCQGWNGSVGDSTINSQGDIPSDARVVNIPTLRTW